MSEQAVVVRESMSQLERMANAMAKSGMFAVKTPEGALSLLLIAQSEGIPPAQAMMDYDVIEGKPALKSAAMLARFQRSGGRVQWLQATDACVEGKFTHPMGGEITVKWDHERVKTAGLADRANHKKFGAQMKRARCITEAIRAIAPQSIPLGMYSVEETQDIMQDEKDVTPAVVPQAQAIQEVTNPTALTDEERSEHIAAMDDADSQAALQTAYMAAREHAKRANDRLARDLFKQAYSDRAAAFDAPAADVGF